MADYRIYPTDRDGRIVGPPREMVASSDEDALNLSQGIFSHDSIEVWCGPRCVARVAQPQEWTRARTGD